MGSLFSTFTKIVMYGIDATVLLQSVFETCPWTMGDGKKDWQSFYTRYYCSYIFFVMGFFSSIQRTSFI